MISPYAKAARPLRRYPFHWLLCSFQGPRRGELCRVVGLGACSPPGRRRHAGLSKLNSMRRLFELPRGESEILPGQPG